jgi:hypothetical protein
MASIPESGQFTIFCEIKVIKKRTAMTNRQWLHVANSPLSVRAAATEEIQAVTQAS